MLIFRLIFESFNFAWQALKGNMLRTILSLLGVTIGIFAIIAVFTIVDSLEKSIRKSMAFLGDNVIYVEKWPWSFGPNYPWWKYFNRPVTSVAEYKFLEKNLENAEAVTFMIFKSGVTVKHESNSMDQSIVRGVSHSYPQVSELKLSQGRFFSMQEAENARNVAIIGADLAKNLFPNENPLGKTVKVRGLQFNVVGIIEYEGENMMGEPSLDIQCFIPHGVFSKLFQTGKKGIEPLISVKGRLDDPGLNKLESELRGLMRSKRSLKPFEEDNFALNRPEMIASMISSTFDVIGLAGWVIGSFSILVGGFGIANIMFVSVKERTNIIGIQKSLGAKNYFILLQFLFESIFLSLFGGIGGIFLVYLITLAIPASFMEMSLSLNNIILGLTVSGIVGVLAGIIPAAVASKLDPVVAIRAK